VAAQSIGEPGTQLTLRTFTQEVLRQVVILQQVCHVWKRLFEARRAPKGKRYHQHLGIAKLFNQTGTWTNGLFL
jgi:hypothetical protein